MPKEILPPTGAQSLQKALLDALEKLQTDSNNDNNMVNWAKENLTEFYKMAARILPAADSNPMAPITEIEIIHTYEDKSQQGTV